MLDDFVGGEVSVCCTCDGTCNACYRLSVWQGTEGLEVQICVPFSRTFVLYPAELGHIVSILYLGICIGNYPSLTENRSSLGQCPCASFLVVCTVFRIHCTP
jgi:hypothetical protein